jgi:Winged helix-turn-helix DNA-binding
MSWTGAGGAMLAGLIPHTTKTFAAWSVWRGSTTAEVKFQPLPKKEATKRWHEARRFDRQGGQRPGCQYGAIGRNGLAVLHSLLFDFLNYASGALYPSYAAIAEKANISESSVWRGLKKLREAGVITWLRRCKEEYVDGRFTLSQDTNAYAVLPSSQWRGFNEQAPAPKPEPGTWGGHQPELSALDLAVSLGREGADLNAKIEALEGAEASPLARALAGLGKALRGDRPPERVVTHRAMPPKIAG